MLQKMRVKDNNHKIVYYRGIIAFYILVIGTISIINVVKRDKDVSVFENRKLEQKPKFSIESFVSGDFNKEYEAYLSDQFPARDFWIKVKSRMQILGGKNKINDVYICGDNYYIEDFQVLDDNIIKQKVETINDFAEKNCDINTYVMIVPTAGCIYSELLPKDAPIDNQEEFIKQIASELSNKIKFIDVLPSLMDNKDKKLYYRTDHHWTIDGAFVAYKEMCNQLGIECFDDYKQQVVTHDFYGSLYYKAACGIGEPESIYIDIPEKGEDVVVNYVKEHIKTASLYNSSKLEGRDKYEVFINGNFPFINIKTECANQKRLLLIKDSFANCYIPFLTRDYEEIDVIDLRYYTDDIQDLIDSYGITDVLFLYNANTFNSDNSILNLK